MVTVDLAEPRGYGRIVRGAGRRVLGIVEENDANPQQKKITEINTGLMAIPARRLKKWLSKVGNKNAKREYYLTDIVSLAVKDKAKVNTISAASAEEVEGVNDRVQLARAERIYQQRQAQRLLREGVHLADPARFDLRGMLLAGKDVRLDVGVIIEGVLRAAPTMSASGLTASSRTCKLGPGTVVEAHSSLDRRSYGPRRAWACMRGCGPARCWPMTRASATSSKPSRRRSGATARPTTCR